MRRPFVCGNWKLNHNLEESCAALLEIVSTLPKDSKVECAVAPVVTLLSLACELTNASPLGIAAQNVFYEKKGAFTGEWSVAHLLELGCSYSVVGHSERRALFGETNQVVARKVQACLAGGLIPIACFGEKLEQREAGLFKSVVESQVDFILDVVDPDHIAQLILAYEPIWAIGTGKTATAEQAQEVHGLVRQLLIKKFGQEAANLVRVIYGGSANADNAATLMAQNDIDGLLVGGASLKPSSFCAIVEAAVPV